MERAIVVFVMLSAVLAFTYLLHRLYASMYDEGRRKGLKEAAEIAAVRAEVGTQVAPTGKLVVALVRSQALHELAAELRAEAGRLG